MAIRSAIKDDGASDYRVSPTSTTSSIRGPLPGIIVSGNPRLTVDSPLRLIADSSDVRAMAPAFVVVLRKAGMTRALAQLARRTVMMAEARMLRYVKLYLMAVKARRGDRSKGFKK